MLRPDSKQLSFHATLYSKIPETHILKQINKVVDFSFINELLAESYCKGFGRPAKEPELMCKLLFLQRIYDLSDERVREEASLNLAYMYFLGINPEDQLPDKSLLAKFRCHRLQETTLDEIITEIVRQCVEKGIIRGAGVSIDSTHIIANTIKKTPERLMKHLGRHIINVLEEETTAKHDQFEAVPDYKAIEDHNEAKAVMKRYLEGVIETAEKVYLEESKPPSSILIKAKEILAEPEFIAQKGIRSLVDQDARVGRKSKTEGFFGYKTEFLMTTDERIITSVKTNNGAYVDGNHVKEMLAETQTTGMNIEELYGDKAYFRKPILDALTEINAVAYIPVSQVVYRIDESHYSYNKDSDEWYCSEGNRTVRKYRYKSKTKTGHREGYKYYFEKSQCQSCPKHKECANKQKSKILIIGLDATEFYAISQWQKSEEFLEKYKKRACIEGKNAELKRFHGLNRAKGYGLKSVSKQSKLTAIAVNIKRIAGIITGSFRARIAIWFRYENLPIFECV